MKLSLIDGLDEDKADEVKEEFVRAFRFRQNLARVLEKEIKTLVVNMCNEDHFKSDWPLLQADKVAQIKSYRKIISLLE